MNIKFCDWRGKSLKKQEDKDRQVWMAASVDESGRVVLSTIEKKSFFFNAHKHVMFDPLKAGITGQPIIRSITARFE